MKNNGFAVLSAVKKSAGVLAAGIVLAAGLISCSGPEDVGISAFNFTKSSNSVLSSTVYGTIDSDANTITLALPSEVYSSAESRSSLVASITLSKSASLVTKKADMDFTQSPLNVVTCDEDGTNRTYMVILEEDHGSVSRGDLMFTEYYSGQSWQRSGANNQYIEIQNLSDSTVDLGCVELTRHAWKDGERVESEDQTVTLSGTLAAGGFAVIYSARCNFFSSKTSTTSQLYINDDKLNSIINLSGEDGLVLSCNGKVLDVLGPEKGYGNGWNWGVAKLMQRKNSAEPGTKYEETQWISYEAANSSTDASNAGLKTATVSSTTTDVTYFALEGLEDTIYGTISTSAKTITLELPSIISKTQYITISTKGEYCTLQNKKTLITSGSTTVNLAKNPVIWVYSSDGNYVEYTINCTFTDYNFSSTSAGTTFTRLTSLPSDGDTIVIYNPANNCVLGSRASSTSLKAVEADASETELGFNTGMADLCVTYVSGSTKYCYLTCNEKFLSATKKSSSSFGLAFTAIPTDYSVWYLEAVSGQTGVYCLVNKNAVYNSNNQYLEYYNDTYSSYGFQSSQSDIYYSYIYKK